MKKNSALLLVLLGASCTLIASQSSSVTKAVSSKEPSSKSHAQIFKAAKEGDLKSLTKLLETGVSTAIYDEEGKTPLQYVVKEGHTDCLKALLEAKQSLRSSDDRNTALLEAAEKGHFESCKLLLDHGAQVNCRDKTQDTPLHRATIHYYQTKLRDIATCKLLVDWGADVNALGFNKRTPLMLVATVELATLFIDNGAKLDAIDSKNRGVLHHAAGGISRPELCKFFVSRGIPVNSPKGTVSPLHCAAEDGNLEICTYLISAGANISAIDEDGCTPLHLAANQGALSDDSVEICRLLIEKGAKVEERDTYGKTPLFHAASNTIFHECGSSPLEICKLLVEKGASVNTYDERQDTPLMRAAYTGNREIVEFLLSKGAMVLACNKENDTPLHMASAGQHFDTCAVEINDGICQLLIQQGANVSFRNRDGDTPLHLAAARGRKEVCELLINEKCPVNEKGWKGLTPLHYAAKNGSEEVCQLLLDNKAIVDAKDDAGYTPLHCAAEKGHETAFGVLIHHGANKQEVTPQGTTALAVAAANEYENLFVKWYPSASRSMRLKDSNDNSDPELSNIGPKGTPEWSILYLAIMELNFDKIQRCFMFRSYSENEVRKAYLLCQKLGLDNAASLIFGENLDLLDR